MRSGALLPLVGAAAVLALAGVMADGLVEVDGVIETRKTAKIRAGQVVEMDGVRIQVVAEA